jgi:Transposase DDE domain/Transposase domain (DUF772)
VTIGQTPTQGSLLGSSVGYCRGRVGEDSIYSLLHRESARLFPDESFADLFQDVGRRSIPPRIVAVAMVLQRVEGLSDREAVDRFSFDLRWKYAAGGLDYDYPGFVHTVLVDMRARLRNSEQPDRIFEAVLKVCKAAGLVGRRRVMDSTALYDAVATQDTVTLIRSAIRGLLRVAGPSLCEELRSVLKRDDDYVAPGKPTCEWDDKHAREAVVDALAQDADAALACMQDRKVDINVGQAIELLATVLGQDLERDEDGTYRIARRVASDRVISTVDPDARHGHKTSARSFDGYKGHISIDPDSEIITANDVTAGNVGDGQAAGPLLDEALAQPDENKVTEVYGDASYGTADIVEKLEEEDVEVNVKVQEPSPPNKGLFAKSAFDIDLEQQTVRCPQGIVVPIKLRKGPDRVGIASFESHCQDCPLKPTCTTSKTGRSIRIHAKEPTLQRARLRQRSEEWKQNYRSIRPKVERKIGHLMRRRHGGRRARVRGRDRVKADFSLLCAATNLKRLARLGARHTGAGWDVFALLLPSILLIIAARALSHLWSPRSPFTTMRHSRDRFRWDLSPRLPLTPVS